MIIKENKYYVLEVGEAELDSTATNLCYKIRNKDTNVIEAETTVLPYALGWVDDFAEQLDVLNRAPSTEQTIQ